MVIAMREILFRGECTETGDWVKGFYVRLYDDKGHESHRIYPGYAETDCGDYYPDWYEVDPETVGQYTGLTDKNGKKIFEGDILSSPDGTFENTGMGHILLYKGMWTSFYGQDAIGRDCFDELYAVCDSREVIGNIHDNPELLGGVSDGKA